MPFKPGDPKPKNSGMKKGQTTKKTVWLKEALSSVGLSWEAEYKKALQDKDYKLIELLHQLIPYLNPKIKDKDIPDEIETKQEEQTTDILKLVNQPNDK